VRLCICRNRGKTAENGGGYSAGTAEEAIESRTGQLKIAPETGLFFFGGVPGRDANGIDFF